MTEADCIAMSGNYEGDGTTSCFGCMPPVLPTGSCFDPSTGECNSGVTAMDCASGGGVYQGDDSTECAIIPSVPTLTQWGLIILGFLLLILGVLAAKEFSIKSQ